MICNESHLDLLQWNLQTVVCLGTPYNRVISSLLGGCPLFRVIEKTTTTIQGTQKRTFPKSEKTDRLKDGANDVA